MMIVFGLPLVNSSRPICHTYRTSSQSSSLHNQPSQTFELLHATLRQNDCTSYSFPLNPVTLSENKGNSNWNQTVQLKIKVIQIGIKLYSLIVFNTIPSLKQFGSQMS